MTSKSPVGDISVVTLIRTDTTLDHSQKAEKVCTGAAALLHVAPRRLGASRDSREEGSARGKSFIEAGFVFSSKISEAWQASTRRGDG